MRPILIALIIAIPTATGAGELQVRLSNAPAEGRLVFQIYDKPNAFGDFRDPAREVVLQATGDGQYQVRNVPAGKVALLVYFDENSNGLIDKNFIGFPREKLALSNNYRPKGPPSFDRASFELSDTEVRTLDLEMFRVLGERGRWGVGVGLIGQSSPYTNSSESVFLPIPVITYIGERLQWFGPVLTYNIIGGGKARLSLTAGYRIGSYEEDDSDVLAGLGDRKGTLMGGLGLQYEMPKGFQLAIGYQHDVIDRIGGGLANVSLSRDFQIGIVRFAPQLSLNWLNSDLSNHDFGVPAGAATADRPEYAVGSSTSVEFGIGTFVELSEDWLLLFNISGEALDDEVTASPIVDDDFVVRGFAAITYTF